MLSSLFLSTISIDLWFSRMIPSRLKRDRVWIKFSSEQLANSLSSLRDRDSVNELLRTVSARYSRMLVFLRRKGIT